MAQALPRTLGLLAEGALLVHQAKVLLHATGNCTTELARQVETEVLAAGGAKLCPADLQRQVTAVVLRVESEAATAATAEQRQAEAVALMAPDPGR